MSPNLVANVAGCVAFACFILNMYSTARKPAAGTAPEGFDGKHFIVMIVLLCGWSIFILVSPQTKGFRDWLDTTVAETPAMSPAPSPTPPPVSPPSLTPAPIPDPVDFTFDPSKGQLVPPAAGIPTGYVLVAKYTSAMSPLTGAHLANGALVDAGLTLPKDATDIQLQFWNKTTNQVTGWGKVK